MTGYDPEEAYERLADITNANLAGAIPAWNAGPTLDEMTVLFEKLDIWLKSGEKAPVAWSTPKEGFIKVVLAYGADTAKAERWVETFMEEYDPDGNTLSYWETVTGLDPEIPGYYPQTPEEQVFCKHGNHIWFGHECGICMEEDE